MTVITLTDVAEARLQSISFFCVTYLLLALGVMLLWNYLAKSFSWMPRINCRRALALMLVSGLFLYVLLWIRSLNLKIQRGFGGELFNNETYCWEVFITCFDGQTRS